MQVWGFPSTGVREGPFMTTVCFVNPYILNPIWQSFGWHFLTFGDHWIFGEFLLMHGRCEDNDFYSFLAYQNLNIDWQALGEAQPPFCALVHIWKPPPSFSNEGHIKCSRPHWSFPQLLFPVHILKHWNAPKRKTVQRSTVHVLIIAIFFFLNWHHRFKKSLRFSPVPVLKRQNSVFGKSLHLRGILEVCVFGESD